MRVKSIKEHPYDGIPRPVGEVYEMDDRYVQIMEQYGNVVRLSPPEIPAIRTRDLNADQPKKYRRRDLKAD